MTAILDALVALGISSAAAAVALPLLLNLAIQPAQNDAGNQLTRMQVAAASYIRKKAPFTAAITVVTPAQLIQDNDLSANFVDGNVFGQQHVLVVATYQVNGTTVTDGMVYTYGGTAMDDQTAIRVAQSGPPDATVVLANPQCAPAIQTKINNLMVCFEGAAGGVALSAATYHPTTPPPAPQYPVAPGHIGAYIEPATYTPTSPFLSRGNTGNAADNTMATNLNMGNMNITNAATVTAAGTVSAGAITTAGTVSAGSVTSAGSITAASATVTNGITASSMTATTGITSYAYWHQSDARLKTNVTPIDHPLDMINSLQGRHFTWKTDGHPDLGFIAQEVQTVLPEAVGTLQSGTLAVKYDVLIAPLVEAVKEQQRQIASLRSQLAHRHGGSDNAKRR